MLDLYQQAHPQACTLGLGMVGEGEWRDVRGQEGGERGRRPTLTLRPPEESGSQNAGLRKDTRIILKCIFPPNDFLYYGLDSFGHWPVRRTPPNLPVECSQEGINGREQCRPK